jgi:hypothetical protein
MGVTFTFTHNLQKSNKDPAEPAQWIEFNDLENRRILAAYRQQVKRMNNYMSSCLEFIIRITANLIHSIIDPNLEINYKHDPTTGLLDKHAAKDDCDDIEPSKDIKNDADNISVNTNTQILKYCPWMEQCRNSHLPYGMSEKNIRFKTRCKFYPFRGIRPLFELSEDLKNDADITSVDTNTQDAANKVIINNKMSLIFPAQYIIK